MLFLYYLLISDEDITCLHSTIQLGTFILIGEMGLLGVGVFAFLEKPATITLVEGNGGGNGGGNDRGNQERLGKPFLRRGTFFSPSCGVLGVSPLSPLSPPLIPFLVMS